MTEVTGKTSYVLFIKPHVLLSSQTIILQCMKSTQTLSDTFKLFCFLFLATVLLVTVLKMNLLIYISNA